MNAMQAPVGAGRWLPEGLGGPAPVYMLTQSDTIATQLQRVASAGNRELVHIASARELRQGAGETLLIGSDVALAESETQPHIFACTVIIVGLADEGLALWEAASRWGAQRVAVLPDAAAWLAELLCAPQATGQTGRLLGVVGACGGAGATTLTAELGASYGPEALLIDADPHSGQLEQMLGLEHTPGIRWSDLAEASGRIGAGQLRDALPATDGPRLLSGDDDVELPSREVARSVVDAARQAFGLVVVDTGRAPQTLAQWSPFIDRVALLVPAHAAAIDAGRRMAGLLQPLPLLAVVTGRLPDGVDGELVGQAVGADAWVRWQAPRAGSSGWRNPFARRRAAAGLRSITQFAIEGVEP